MDLNKTFSAVQYASRKLLALNDEKINQILLAVADAAEKRTDFILAENRKTWTAWTSLIRSTTA